MYYTKSQRDYYNAHRQYVLERLGITQNQYNWFRRIGDQLHSLYEQNCNGTIDEQTYEKQEKYWTDKADTKTLELGLFIYYQTDPRGSTIYLDNNAIPDNNYSKACCIY